MADKDLEAKLAAKLAELEARDAEMQLLEQTYKQRIQQMDDLRQQSGGITADVLEKILGRVTDAAAAPAQVLASKLRPENSDHLHKGPFEHPLGGLVMPKPPLKREETFFCGHLLRISELTYDEVLAVNALHESLQRSQKRTARNGKWSAVINDGDSRLTISVPANTMDARSDLPSFLEICVELTSGERAPDMRDVMAELQLLRAKVAQLEAVPVGV